MRFKKHTNAIERFYYDIGVYVATFVKKKTGNTLI